MFIMPYVNNDDVVQPARPRKLITLIVVLAQQGDNLFLQHQHIFKISTERAGFGLFKLPVPKGTYLPVHGSLSGYVIYSDFTV